MEWHKDGIVWQPPEEFNHEIVYGFVYLITNQINQRKYIGKKFFWSQKTLPVTKTRKRKKKIKVESDWRKYYGSSKHLVNDIEEFGVENFSREILHLCKTKGVLSYMEMKEQVEREVLLTDQYYNGIIQCRIGSNSVKPLKKDQ